MSSFRKDKEVKGKEEEEKGKGKSLCPLVDFDSSFPDPNLLRHSVRSPLGDGARHSEIE